MSGFDAKTLKRLLPALDAVKERDAAVFRARRDAAEAVRREIAETEAAITEAGRGLDPSDLAGSAALTRFRAAATARIQSLKRDLEARAADELAARRTLARSNGKLEGCTTLAAQAERPRRR